MVQKAFQKDKEEISLLLIIAANPCFFIQICNSFGIEFDAGILYNDNNLIGMRFDKLYAESIKRESGSNPEQPPLPYLSRGQEDTIGVF